MVLPQIDSLDTEVEVGGFTLPCPVCGIPMPVTVHAQVVLDEDGDHAVHTRADASDTWAHVWSHDNGLAGEVPDDA